MKKTKNIDLKDVAHNDLVTISETQSDEFEKRGPEKEGNGGNCSCNRCSG